MMVMAASVAGTHEEKGREGEREDGTFLGIGELTLVHAPRRYHSANIGCVRGRGLCQLAAGPL